MGTRCKFRRTVRWMVSFGAPKGSLNRTKGSGCGGRYGRGHRGDFRRASGWQQSGTVMLGKEGRCVYSSDEILGTMVGSVRGGG